MNNLKIYENIAKRTDGDIYIGVVGPVRTGKSTLIQKIMENFVIPNIEDKSARDRAVDEMPQSSAGRTIMTTEPKFVPEEAVEISLGDTSKVKIRLVDCVGYIVPSAIGYIENEEPRMVMTPWFPKEIPFNMAAEIGTQKVINEHSTIGLVVTSDGSLSEIPREEYEEAEERVISELKELDKPFSIVLNCTDPFSDEAKALRESLEKKHNVPVAAVNCLNLREEDIAQILEGILCQFPLKEIMINIPSWIMALPKDHWLKSDICRKLIETAAPINKMNELSSGFSLLEACPHLSDFEVESIDFGSGSAKTTAHVKNGLFYKVIEEQTGIPVKSETDLMPVMVELSNIKKEYERYKNAIEEVKATGYGIVMPTTEQLTLESPEIIKNGGRYGVRLKASAPSIHLMQANIETEISPMVGSERQSQELINYLMEEFDEAPEKIWESNIFGKSLYSLVNEGLHNKLGRMPNDARLKLAQTIERIINEGCSGLICIII